MAITQEEQIKHDKLVQEWLAKGNKITVCEPGARTDDVQKLNRWKGKSKAKKVDKTT
jgi:hypothetical protein